MRRSPVLLSAILAVGAVCLSLPASATTAAVSHRITAPPRPLSHKSGFSVERVYPPALNALDDVFCASTHDCLALGDAD